MQKSPSCRPAYVPTMFPPAAPPFSVVTTGLIAGDQFTASSGGYSLLALSCPASAGSKGRSGKRWRISLEKDIPEMAMQ